MSNLNVVSLFSGCGGLDLGFKEAGFEIRWANELEKDAANSYKKLIGDHILTGDINGLTDKVPKADVLIGGPPCQSFSLVGKRVENDPRGKLVFTFLEMVKQTMPKTFVMENVPGLLASKVDGIRLTTILEKKFKELGYSVSTIKLLASDYLVPQKRRRVVMVGMLDTEKPFRMLTTEEFATRIGLGGVVAPLSVSKALDDLPAPLPKGSLELNTYDREPHSWYARLMREKNFEKVSNQVMPTMSKLDGDFVKFIPPGGNYMNIPDEISTKRIMNFKKSGGRTTTYGRLHPDKPAYTINTYFNRPNVGANYHHLSERLITVREAMRLQSFPDHFIPEYSTQRSLHQQIGNAVPPLLSRAIAESIKESWLNE